MTEKSLLLLLKRVVYVPKVEMAKPEVWNKIRDEMQEEPEPNPQTQLNFSSEQKLGQFYDRIEEETLQKQLNKIRNISKLSELKRYVQYSNLQDSVKKEDWVKIPVSDTFITIPYRLFSAEISKEMEEIYQYFGIDPEKYRLKDFSWKTHECSKGHKLIKPSIRAGSKNPWSRYRSNIESARKSLKNIENLMEVKTVYSMDLTFPKSVTDMYLGNKKEIKDKCFKALDQFRNIIEETFKSLLGIESDEFKLPWSSNFHDWSSEKPLKPHLHFHNLILMSLMKSISRTDLTEFYERFKDKHHLDSVVDWDVYGKGSLFRERINRIVKNKPELRDKFESEYSKLIDNRTIKPEHFMEDNKPLTVQFVRKVWKKCVKDVFGNDIYDGKKPDIYLSYMDSETDKNQILHKLKYKSRPPVLDLSYYLNSMDRRDGNKIDIEEHEEMLKRLVFRNNRTRIYGPWTRLRYYYNPLEDHGETKKRCMICGSEIIDSKDFMDLDKNPTILEEQRQKFNYGPPPEYKKSIGG